MEEEFYGYKSDVTVTSDEKEVLVSITDWSTDSGEELIATACLKKSEARQLAYAILKASKEN